MRKPAIGAVAVLAVAAVMVVWLAAPGDRVPQAAAQMPPPAVPVTAGIVRARDMPVYLNGIGTVEAYNEVAVKSRADGQIVKIAFTEGQEVKAGEPLIEIDPRPYQAALDEALAAQEKDQAKLQGDTADLNRYARLVGPGFQTRQSYDQQKATVAQDQAALKADGAQIETARLNLSYCDIRAPIAGRLGARLVDVGNLVHASANTTLVTINQMKPIFVSFTLPQKDLDRIRAQQTKAPLVVNALSGNAKRKLATGKLTLIDNAINQATGTIDLKARFANRHERLWPGEFVNVRLILEIRHDVPTVPSQTVEKGPVGHFVYVIKPNDTVERRAVALAGVQNGRAIITKGLAAGERVVVNGQYRLTDGARVEIARSKPATG